MLAVGTAAPSTGVTKHWAGTSVLLTDPACSHSGKLMGWLPWCWTLPCTGFSGKPQSFSLEEGEAVPARLHFVRAGNDKMLPERCVTIAVPSVHGFIFLCPR